MILLHKAGFSENSSLVSNNFLKEAKNSMKLLFVISYNIRINVSLWCLENIAKLRRNPFVYLTALIWFFTSSPAHFSIRLLNKLFFLCYWCSFFFKSKSHLINRVKSLIIIHCSRKMFKTFCGYFNFKKKKITNASKRPYKTSLFYL